MNTNDEKKFAKDSNEYYNLLYNIVDCNVTLKHARMVLDKKFKFLSSQVSQQELERYARLYHLIKKLKYNVKIYSFFQKYKMN